MKGKQKLYKPYFTKSESDKQYSRGRSNALINRRDRKLAIRYWYHTTVKKLGYEETIKCLQIEFDIAEFTVVKRLEKENAHINKLMEKSPVLSELKKEFAYFNW